MTKRILCFVLAALLLLSLIPAFTLPTRAASNMRTSETCIAILKEMEGFAEFPYFDYSHYSVGYGSTCGKDDYPNGITEAEADALLRAFIADMERALNQFVESNQILLSQYQFDALMLFTYNCGTGWMISDGLMRQAVIDNASVNDFLYPFTLWSAAGGQTHMGLVRRRLREANMYLNGIYSAGVPANYTYAFYNNNGGVGTPKVHGYDSTQKAYVKSTPTREGYVLLGWYSAADGGEWVRYLTAGHSEKTIYAHWQSVDAAPGSVTAAAYEIPAVELLSRELFDLPGGTVQNTMAAAETAEVNGDYVDGDGVKWGRLTNGYWVKLGDPLVGVPDDAVVEAGLPVIVTGDVLNIRRGPGTTYDVVAQVIQEATVYLTRVTSVDGVLWGRCRAGWLCLEYTDYAGGLPTEEPSEDMVMGPEMPAAPQTPVEKVVAAGTVLANQLYIRSVAGSRGSPVGSFRRGDRVELLEITTIGHVKWGRTKSGWISLTYVEINTQFTDEEILETVPEELEVTLPDEEVMPLNPESEKGQASVVVSKTELNIRAGAGTDYDVIGSYKSGQKIRIQEQISRNGILWGRTDLGWVRMQYVRLEKEIADDTDAYGTVTGQGGVTIRSGAGVGYTPIGAYGAGSRIRILEQVTVSGQRWGRTDLGWVSMDHVRLDTHEEEKQDATEETVTETTVPDMTVPEETEDPAVGTVIVASLNIRRSFGTGGVLVDTYRSGDRVTILETRQTHGTLWGRTDLGWINLSYVMMDDQDQQEIILTGQITSDVLCIRKGPGSGNVIVGMYNQGDAVTILEEIRVGVTFWGRTDRGWICLDYVK